MNPLKRLAIGVAAALGLALLLPTGSFATARVLSQSPCTGSGADFGITVGFDSSNREPTASPSVNSACVSGGDTISFGASSLPSGWSWSVVFPEPSLNNPVLANGCTFGSGTNQSSRCTVITSPTAGDYYYTVILTDANGNEYTLDPRVIIAQSGMPGATKKHHKKPASPATTAPPSQQ